MLTKSNKVLKKKNENFRSVSKSERPCSRSENGNMFCKVLRKKYGNFRNVSESERQPYSRRKNGSLRTYLSQKDGNIGDMLSELLHHSTDFR